MNVTLLLNNRDNGVQRKSCEFNSLHLINEPIIGINDCTVTVLEYKGKIETP